MEIKPIKLNLDLKIDTREFIKLMQGYDYTLECFMYDDGEELLIDSAIIQVQLLNADNTYIIQSKDITKQGNKITIDLAKKFTNIAGFGKLQIVATIEDITFGSWVVDVDIKESAIYESIGESENKEDLISQLMDTIKVAAKTQDELKEIIANGEQLKETEFVNVKKFGVIGNGIADDTEAMQRAFDNGGKLYAPDTYLLSGELKIKSNTHLKGVKGKTIFKKKEPKYIRKADGSNRWTILAQIGATGVADVCENVTIEGIIFDGNSGRSGEQYIKAEYGDAQQGAKLIDASNVNGLTIKDVTVRNNNYLGSGLTSCRNVLIENFKSINCDVAICMFKDERTSTPLENYVFNNIYIDGHDMSEGISFYNKSYIKNVKLNDITILNKEKGTALILGTEYGGDYGVIDAQVSNVLIKNSAIGMSLPQKAENIQCNNINIENCTRGLIVTQTAKNNQFTNVNIKNIKSHGLLVETKATKNDFINVNLRDCNTLKSSDNVGFVICNGNDNTFKNVCIFDSSAEQQHITVCRGSNNVFDIPQVDKATGKMYLTVFQGAKNNKFDIKSKQLVKIWDKNANLKTSFDNDYNYEYGGEIIKGISTNDVNFTDSIHTNLGVNLTTEKAIQLTNITLFNNYKRITLIIQVNNQRGTITLSDEGNIKWKSTDTITNGQKVISELICINNKWIELNRN